MGDSDKITRKPPVEPLKVQNSLYDRRGLPFKATPVAGTESLEQAVRLLEKVCGCFGREIFGVIKGDEVLFSDRKGTVITMGTGKVFSIAGEMRVILGPLLDREA
ncbi:MAG TPA: hypothetical protein ENN89_04190 [Synergistetes bacterium]|nr:hypothetical protein [Synergistota bacterium]